MSRLIINVAMTVNGAFEVPTPDPNGWLVLDADSQQASLDMWRSADAMVVGRKTYESLSAVWPQMADVSGFEDYAHRMNAMKKYVVSRTLTEPLAWNATLLDGDLIEGIAKLKDQNAGDLVTAGAGPLVDELLRVGLVDEIWLTVSPYLWGVAPRVFERLGAVPLDLVSATAFRAGVIRLCYRPRHSAAGATR
jgi:dihydrofolate reductase